MRLKILHVKREAFFAGYFAVEGRKNVINAGNMRVVS